MSNKAITVDQFLQNIRPDTLARLAAELREDIQNMWDIRENEQQIAAFALVMAAGAANMGEDEFAELINEQK